MTARITRRRFKEFKVGRFDDEFKSIIIDDGDTISSVLSKAGITLSEGEEVNSMNGLTLALTKKVKDGDRLVIVGAYKSGK